MEKEPKCIQVYDLHMKNGKVITYSEPFEIPNEKGIVEQFKRRKKKFLEFGDYLYGYVIPFDQISFIVATDVKEIY